MIPSPKSALLPEWHYLVSLLTQQQFFSCVDSYDVSIRKVLQLAKANALLLAAGDALKRMDSNQLLPDDYEARYQQAKSLEKNTHQLIQEVLIAFRQSNLLLLTIKSFLPFSYIDNNIDLVAVETDKVGHYRRVLGELGFKHWFSLADFREPNKKIYYSPNQEKEKKVHPMLHLHQAISWNGLDYLDLSTVWHRHRLIKVDQVQVPVPSFEDAILIMAAHAIFENKYISLHELIYLQWLTSHSLDWNYIVESSKLFFWQKALMIFLATAVNLGQASGLVIKVEIDLPSLSSKPQIPLPYLLPMRQTFAVSWEKLGRDLASGHWRSLPRQFFSYSFVDGIWMYRKARRKRRAIASI